MRRQIIAYQNYYKDFFDALDKSTQEKVLYGLLLLKTQDKLSSKYVRFIQDGLFELRIEWKGKYLPDFLLFRRRADSHIIQRFSEEVAENAG